MDGVSDMEEYTQETKTPIRDEWGCYAAVLRREDRVLFLEWTTETTN